MTQTVTATYENGVLRPAAPLPLAEGETVEITITRPVPPPPLTEEETIRRIREAKSLEEMFAAFNASAALEPDDGYDLREALNENRRVSGDVRMLFRNLALKYHPDRGGSPEAMRALNEFHEQIQELLTRTFTIP